MQSTPSSTSTISQCACDIDPHVTLKRMLTHRHNFYHGEIRVNLAPTRLMSFTELWTVVSLFHQGHCYNYMHAAAAAVLYHVGVEPGTPLKHVSDSFFFFFAYSKGSTLLIIIISRSLVTVVTVRSSFV